jgi:hypothetical protein
MLAKAATSRVVSGKESLQEERKTSIPRTQMGPRLGPRKKRFNASGMLFGITSDDADVDVSATSCFVFVLTTRSGAAAENNLEPLSNDLE